MAVKYLFLMGDTYPLNGLSQTCRPVVMPAFLVTNQDLGASLRWKHPQNPLQVSRWLVTNPLPTPIAPRVVRRFSTEPNGSRESPKPVQGFPAYIVSTLPFQFCAFAERYHRCFLDRPRSHDLRLCITCDWHFQYNILAFSYVPLLSWLSPSH